jgi:hypothetical protein
MIVSDIWIRDKAGLHDASNGLLPLEAGGHCPLVGVSTRDARLPDRGDKHTLTSSGDRFAGG